jgi:riboflavin kinase/FMN adenylyltransferase
LLADLGLDALVVLRFTPELAATPAERFVSGLLVGRLAVREVHVGRGFAFGHHRRGTFELLEGMGRDLGFLARGVPELEDGEGPISATRIRAALAAGRVEETPHLLGRCYSVAGTVVHGDRRGRALGFPTLNVATDNEILPADGVYVARARLGAAAGHLAGVANVGLRPTIGHDVAPVVEAHLLDFDRDCYGEPVEVEFLARLREERRFGSLEALKAQIARDVAAAREYFSGAGRSDSGERVDAAAQSPREARKSLEKGHL